MSETEIEEYRKWLVELPEQWLLPRLLITESENLGFMAGARPFPWPWKQKELAVIEAEIQRSQAKLKVLREIMGLKDEGLLIL